jgi:hypothetical protein
MSLVGIPTPSSVLLDVSHAYVLPETLEENVNERVLMS